MPTKAELAELGQELKWKWHQYAASCDCVVCGCDHTKFYIEGHHVVYRKKVEDTAHYKASDPVAQLRLAWDLRNCLPLCRLCHARHHNARRKIKRKEIVGAAPKAWQFAAEIGLGWFISRYYDMGSERNGSDHLQGG